MKAAHAPPAFSAPVKGHSPGHAVHNAIGILSSVDQYVISRNVSAIALLIEPGLMVSQMEGIDTTQYHVCHRAWGALRPCRDFLA